ncbi:MAG: hypothetical protein WC399_03675 [Bacilli bacterium]|jgi:hypothetical protein
MMGYLGTFLLFIVIDMVITFVLRLLGVPYYVIDIVVALVMAFIFAFIRHDKRRGPFLKDVTFHRNFATLFIILLAISFLIGYFI